MPSQWSTTKPEIFYSSTAGVDPAIDWALGSGRNYYFALGEKEKDPWLPVTLQFAKISARDLASGARFVRTKKESGAWEKGIQIPSFYSDPPKGLEEVRFCTAWVRESFLGTLVGLAPEYIERIELSLPLRAESLGKAAPTPPKTGQGRRSRGSRLRRLRRGAKP